MQPLNEFPTDPRTGLDLITIPEDLSRQFEGSGLGSYNAQGVLQDQDAIAAAAARKKHAAATAGRRGHGSSKSGGGGKTAQDSADANESTAVDLPGFHWFGKVERMGGADGDIPTARMCVVTDESLFLCRLTGGLSFCLKIGRIDEVMISDSGRCLGLRAKTPPAYDLQLRFQNTNDAKTVLKIAQRIHWYETGDRVKIREIETGKAAAQAALIFGPGQGPMAAMHRPPSGLDLRNQGLSQSRNQSQTFGQNQNQNLGQRQSHQQQRASVGGTSSVEGRSLLSNGGGAQSFRDNSPDPRMVVSENADFGSDDGRVLSRNSSFTRSKGAPEPPSLLDAARSQAAKTQRRFLMDKAKRVAASREVTEGHLAAIRAELREELEGFRTDEYEHTVDQLASYAAPLAEREQEVTRLRTALAEAKKRETRCPTCEKYMALLASHPLDDRRRIGMLERELRGLQEVMQHARSCLETRDQERRRTERSSAEDGRRMKVLAAETEEERREIIAELDAIQSEHDRAVKEERTRRRHEAEEKTYREAKAKEEEHRAQHPGAPSDHFPSSTMAVGSAVHLHGSALLSGDFMTKMAKLEAPVTASKGGVPIGTLKPHGGGNGGGGFDATERPFSTEQDWRREGGTFSPTDHGSAVSFEGAAGAQQHRRASAASSSGASAGDGDLNDEKQRRRRSTNKQKGGEKGKKDGKEVRRPRMLAELDGPPIPDDLPSLKVELQLEREELLALAQRAARRAEDSFDIEGAKRRALSLEDEIDALKSKLKSAEDDHVAQMQSVKAAFAEYERNAALAASSAELKRSGGLASTFGSVTPALARSPWGKPLDGTTQHQQRSTRNDRDQQQQHRDRAHSTPTTQHRGQSPATSQRYGQAAAQDRAIDLTPSSRRVPAPVTPPALASPSTAHRHDGVEQGRYHPSSGQYGRSGDGVPVPCTPGQPCSDRSAAGSAGVFGGLVPPGFSPSPSHQLSKGRSDLPDGYSTPLRPQVHLPISAAKATTTPMKTPAQPEGAQGYTRRAEGIIHTESPLLTAAMSAPYAPQSKQQSTTPKSTPIHAPTSVSGALSSRGATPQQSERYQQQYQQQSFKSPTGQFPAACTAAAATATNVTAAAKEESWLGATSAGVPGLDAGEYRHFDKMTSADRQPHQTNGQAAARHHVDARSDQATEFRGGRGPLIAPYGSFGVAPALYGHRTQRTDVGLPRQW